MRALFVSKILPAAAALVFLFAPVFGEEAGEVGKMLPDRVGAAVAKGRAFKPEYRRPPQYKAGDVFAEQPDSDASRRYTLPDGKTIRVGLFKVRSDSAAYSLLSLFRQAHEGQEHTVTLGDVGTAAVYTPKSVTFYKGPVVVTVEGDGEPVARAELTDFARSLAESLDAGEGELPVLVKHLPEWETAHARAVYAYTLQTLRQAARTGHALEVVPFDGGTEAVTADYGAAGRLVIVEFATPQIAFDADAAVKRRIEELRAAGQGVPAVYKRVGNYSVFVFDAKDAAAAEQLAGQVRYEKDVRWLGNDPYEYERHNRAWLNMSASVIINTVKATGLAVLLCLGVGGFFGALIFRRRRAQAALTESYSDAGGMMCLNLDEHAAKLLGRGQK